MCQHVKRGDDDIINGVMWYSYWNDVINDGVVNDDIDDWLTVINDGNIDDNDNETYY